MRPGHRAGVRRMTHGGLHSGAGGLVRARAICGPLCQAAARVPDNALQLPTTLAKCPPKRAVGLRGQSIALTTESPLRLRTPHLFIGLPASQPDVSSLVRPSDSWDDSHRLNPVRQARGDQEEITPCRSCVGLHACRFGWGDECAAQLVRKA
eukprot:797045-Amphidinium_carterae.2